MLVNFMAFWSILLPSGMLYGPLAYFVVILVYIFPVLVCCSKTNLATLVSNHLIDPHLYICRRFTNSTKITNVCGEQIVEIFRLLNRAYPINVGNSARNIICESQNFPAYRKNIKSKIENSYLWPRYTHDGHLLFKTEVGKQ
jgi:hypothetical protein